MKKLIKDNMTGDITLEDVPAPTSREGHIISRNIFSCISLGTEKSSVSIGKKNLIEKAISRPADLQKVVDLAKKNGAKFAYEKAMDRLQLPTSLGYSSVGVVEEVGEGIKDIKKGDLVSCSGEGHSEVISVPQNLCLKLPNNIDLVQASMITISSIALQGIRQAGINIGENIAVIGLGLIGQITMELLNANGTNTVGIDINNTAVKEARKNGFTALNSKRESFLDEIMPLTKGYGFDSVIITASTQSNNTIEIASKICRDRGNITILGDVKTDLPRKEFYGKELSLNFSRSYGPGRYDSNYEGKGLDYPIGYVRWTEKRNMETILDLILSKKINLHKFVNKKIAFSNSEELYSNLDKEDIKMGIIIEYDSKVSFNKSKIITPNLKINKGNLGVGVIGAGNYAQNVFLPILSNTKGIDLVSLSSNKGELSSHIAKKFLFRKSTTDNNELLRDNEIDCLFILTRHDTHSELVLSSMKNDKHVFVEKPLAMNIADLDQIKKLRATSRSNLMVGYNRRFSEATFFTKQILSDRKSPITINYVINVDKLDNKHWTHDIDLGGGRLIGELCHFIDFCKHLTDSEIVSFNDYSFKSLDVEYNNTISLSIKFADQSIANISYLFTGAKTISKETISIFGEGKVVVINDFKNIEIHMNNKKRIKTFNTNDKGQERMIKEFILSLKQNHTLIDFDDLYEVTSLTFNL